MSKQTGVAPIAIIIAIVLILLAGGGYFLVSRSGSLPSALPSLPGALSLNSNCKYNDPDLCKFVNNWKDMKNYSAKSISTSKDGKFETLMEISGADKFHMLSSENNKESYNLITIGDTTYTKDYTDNKWWKQKTDKKTDDLKSQVEFKVPEATTDSQQVEDKTTYKSMGKEACASKQCFKYQVINPDVKDSTEYIWFDDKEYLLRKSRTESGGVIDETEYAYDKVNVSEPSPTKDAKPGEVIIPGGGTVPGFSQEEMKKIQEESQKTIDAMPKDNQALPVTEPDTSDNSQ